jgi:hypothetical protein
MKAKIYSHCGAFRTLDGIRKIYTEKNSRFYYVKLFNNLYVVKKFSNSEHWYVICRVCELGNHAWKLSEEHSF